MELVGRGPVGALMTDSARDERADPRFRARILDDGQVRALGLGGLLEAAEQARRERAVCERAPTGVPVLDNAKQRLLVIRRGRGTGEAQPREQIRAVGLWRALHGALEAKVARREAEGEQRGATRDGELAPLRVHVRELARAIG